MAYNYSDSGYVYSGTLSDSSIYSDEKSDSDIITLTKTIGNTLIIDDSFWIMTVSASNVKNQDVRTRQKEEVSSRHLSIHCILVPVL